MLADYEPGSRVTVLDLGPGCASTVRYFSDFVCHLVFYDILECEHLIHPDEDADYVSAIKHCQRHMALPPNLQIDVLLLWDYLHFLDVKSIEALSIVLQPHVHQQTKAYGFGSLHSDKPMYRRRYGVHSAQELQLHESTDQPLPYAHSQQRLTDAFMCLRITRGTLLQEGHLELLFEAP